MRDLLYPEDSNGAEDAFVSARGASARQLPKRFYTLVSVEAADGGHRLLLDGKPALTPGRRPLALATPAATQIVAEEWSAVDGRIDPALMHATRIANVGLDRVGAARDAVVDDAAKYAASDLVCYRADGPEGLVACESAAWDKVLEHIRKAHGASFVLSEGIGFAEQPEASRDAIRAAVAGIADPVALAAFHTMTTIAGSVLIALMVADGAMPADEAFAAASVEEDWNARLWGEDAEASARRARRRAEFLAAAGLLGALAAPTSN